MTKPQANSSVPKSKALAYLEYVLLGLCLCVIGLRATFTEGPPTQSSTLPGNLGDSVYSLSVSALLLLAFVLWFVWSFCGKRFLYRLTGIEIGLGIFCVAAVTAGLAAPDKRGAISSFTGLMAPVLMALLLVQILNSQTKIKLILILIVALGMVSTYRCWEQYSENEHLIEFYEQDPDEALAQHRIAPNSLEHFQFEHRLYSKDISGFFTTSNSAGSFAMMASFAAVVLLIGRFKNRNPDSLEIAWLIMRGIAVAIVILGLVITKSKGAITASIFAATMFVIYLCLGNWLRVHKKVILIACLLLGIAGGWIVVQYGLNHGRLPGGNSMLVRWQYWHASAKMYADHWLTGVGPGNFAHFYPHYKAASASESVADPHNFLLSILTQYGPIGLVGFLAMICMPLWAVLSDRSANRSSEAHQSEPAFKKTAIVFAIIVSAFLLFIRPIVFPLPPTATPQERQAGIIILYVMPVIIFIAGFLLASAGETTKMSHSGIAMAALFCAVLGVGLHNLIDFAIFEPGVFTTFWAILACLIAIDSRADYRPQLAPTPLFLVRIVIVAAALAAGWAYLNYTLVPVAKSNTKIQQAHRAVSVDQFDYAHDLLDKAAKNDPLSHAALSLNGRVYLHHFQLTQRKDRDLLLDAEECLLAAIERNDVAFKNFERLTEVYCLLAETSTQQQKADWLNKAFGSAWRAVERYPGCGRLHFNLAQVAEQLGKNNIAVEQYRKAIEIEDEYRAQFRQIYPEREEVVSRLGEEKYRDAKQQIGLLSEQPSP